LAVKVIDTSSTLRVLDLGGNNIGDAGCAAVAGAVFRHLSLVELHLDHNGIGAEGAAALEAAMVEIEGGYVPGIRRLW
jgi:Ran GTPase-activating protein (RanGAP) involved in mRNA processing and transport